MIFILFCSLIFSVASFIKFKAFNLLTNDIIIISDEGIIKYDLQLGTKSLILSNNITFYFDRISFAQFPLDEGGYIICRINSVAYVLSSDASTIYGNITIPDFEALKVNIVPYTNKNGKTCLIFSYVRYSLKISIEMYEIDIDSFNNSQKISQYYQNLQYFNGTIVYLANGLHSCDIMKSEDNGKILVCFFVNNKVSVEVAAFNQENGLSLLYLFSNEEIVTGMSSLNGIISKNKDKYLICYIDLYNNFKCLLYYSNKKWSQTITFFKDCKEYNNNKGILASKENEFLVYCHTDSNYLKMIKLDENFIVKETNEEDKCFFDLEIEGCSLLYASSLLYNKYNYTYFLSISCILYTNYIIRNDELQYKCSYKSQLSDFKYYQENDENNISSSYISSMTTKSILSTFSNLQSSFLAFSSYLASSETKFLPSISSSTIQKETIQKSISSSQVFLNSTSIYLENILSTNIIKKNNIINEYEFYIEGDIMKGKTNKTKEEIANNLPDIINAIEIGKKYEINGKDYNISISPVDIINSFQTSFISEFSICEQILRKNYNMSEEEIITILQVEINKANEQILINQIEYELYNEEKKKLDLSLCKDVPIKVQYEIKDSSLINKTMINYYSDLGIDIFNSKDSFFNDICYPFSNENSDIILKDRVLDIYQNYSVCDSGCTYDKIDIESMSVTCSCQAKTKIDMEVSEPVFFTIIEDTFKDSSFGVIKCYNLVFKFKNKFKNVGFVLFLFFTLCHIFIFILYFIYGINSIKLFVYKEMEKNNYIVVIHPPRRKNIKKYNKIYTSNESISTDKKKLSIICPEESKSSKFLIKKDKTTNQNIFQNTNSKLKFNKISQNININNPIMVFKCNYNYCKDKNKSSSHYKNKIKKFNNFPSKKISSKKIKSNEENQNFPGYYELIQINSNNEKNNKPPESKYILDNYNYEYAIKYDNRDFWRIFYIILLSKENILNTFFFKSPLEIKSLKYSLFIFSYTSDFALNALFYFSQNISDKYHYEGENLYWFSLLNNLTISIFSTLFSYLLVKILGVLTNSKDSIENLFRTQEELLRKNKKYKVDKNSKLLIINNLQEIYKILKIKIICYVIIEFSILLFFFYYITAFCEVYKSTQISWVCDSLVSFALSIPIEFIISFFHSMVYEISIKFKLKALYNIVLFFYGLG